MADYDHLGVRVCRAGNPSATRCPRDRGSWWARRGAGCRVRRKGPQQARRACASRPRMTSRVALCASNRSPGHRGCVAARAGAEWAPICEPCLDLGNPVRDRLRSRPLRAGWRVPYRRQARPRSTSPGHPAPPGRRSRSSEPRPVVSRPRARSRPGIMRKSVVLPVPLRPTKPTREPVWIADGRLVEKRPRPEPVRDVVDMKHGALVANVRPTRKGKRAGAFVLLHDVAGGGEGTKPRIRVREHLDRTGNQAVFGSRNR